MKTNSIENRKTKFYGVYVYHESGDSRYCIYTDSGSEIWIDHDPDDYEIEDFVNEWL